MTKAPRRAKSGKSSARPPSAQGGTQAAPDKAPRPAIAASTAAVASARMQKANEALAKTMLAKSAAVVVEKAAPGKAGAKSQPKKSVAPAVPRPSSSAPPAINYAEIDEARRRCGFVAIIGAPNAGKSTLVNALVGTKVTIVSHKVQTTRMPIRGIAMVDEAQLIFIDTPGIFQPRRRLDRAMVQAAWGGARDADLVVLLVDGVRGASAEIEALTEQLASVNRPRILAINKVDVAPKERILLTAQALNARLRFDETFMISAATKSGVADLKARLGEFAPAGPWHFDPEDVSDAPLRRLAAEITREKLYHRLHEELPYMATVETTSWKELGGKKGVRIEQTIFVERESQRAIVLGHEGQAIKQISMAARKDLTEIIDQPVHLFLHVTVREGWEHDPERYREMGLEFPKE